ncbi:lasso peptide biosynthesis PqqD family chaperone [Neobacillus sp. PS3-40]|uniref:lasso peptide biosynthesis PqqD family chaperone n=1 Tax=Neobacillus sp. PS3-40 TaxID=3070679 RepID=UPI0027E1425E|nr:lasso peptide biosynthesis PqqD family chaperone [Neobacillus sp. PS3-40]WML45836.1 lasso peptide biosynthesis PqqD family chaperone [Neobacillus sp. PS3-40]
MIDTKISIKSPIKQCEGNIVSDMDGDKVMLSIKNGKYYNLGSLGGEIWDLIKAPIKINQLITILISEYQIEKSECEQQVLTFIEQLYSEGLIQIVNQE